MISKKTNSIKSKYYTLGTHSIIVIIIGTVVSVWHSDKKNLLYYTFLLYYNYSQKHRYPIQFSKYLDSFYAICIPQTYSNRMLVFTID